MTATGQRPRLLDLFSGAGGAAMGYYRAGFDVTGVDIVPQPHYPFEFVQHDAMELLDDVADYGVDVLHDSFGHIDAIHASPPCQDHMRSGLVDHRGTGGLLAATRGLLVQLEMPWVIENVPGAPMRADFKLCGCMFGLPRLKRERWFETSWRGFDLRAPCAHQGRAVSVYGHPGWRDGSRAERIEAMGIDWMSDDEIAQAIPPAYTEYIGRQLLDVLAACEVAS